MVDKAMVQVQKGASENADKAGIPVEDQAALIKETVNANVLPTAIEGGRLRDGTDASAIKGTSSNLVTGKLGFEVSPKEKK